MKAAVTALAEPIFSDIMNFRFWHRDTHRSIYRTDV